MVNFPLSKTQGHLEGVNIMMRELLIYLFDTALAVTAGLALGGFFALKSMGYEILETNPEVLSLEPADWALFIGAVILMTIFGWAGKGIREARKE
jgi:hypothetical protein